MKNIFTNCINWLKKIFRRKKRRVSLDDEYDFNYNLL